MTMSSIYDVTGGETPDYDPDIQVCVRCGAFIEGRFTGIEKPCPECKEMTDWIPEDEWSKLND